MGKNHLLTKAEILYYHKEAIGEKKQVIVAKEFPLVIYLNGHRIITLPCTGDYLEYLALGFLLNEDIISKKDEISKITRDKENIYIETKDPDQINKRIYSKGGAFYDVVKNPKVNKIESEVIISSEQIFRLMQALERKATLYKRTHGVHNSALCIPSRVNLFHKDISRHNAIDKINGQCFCDNIEKRGKLIITSGRISSEIVTKIHRMNIPILISRSSPTDLAINLAQEVNITLIANVRNNEMAIYSHPFRVRLGN